MLILEYFLGWFPHRLGLLFVVFISVFFFLSLLNLFPQTAFWICWCSVSVFHFVCDPHCYGNFKIPPTLIGTGQVPSHVWQHTLCMILFSSHYNFKREILAFWLLNKLGNLPGYEYYDEKWRFKPKPHTLSSSSRFTKQSWRRDNV